jgi:hypothetical protein
MFWEPPNTAKWTQTFLGDLDKKKEYTGDSRYTRGVAFLQIAAFIENA